MKKKEDHQFDEQIRRKMTHLSPESSMPDWDAFEEQLGAAEELDAGPAQAGTREVDEVIFAKMHQYEVPYKPSHWYRMEARLNEWFTWPQYVLRYKSMELALFLLLFLTCWQYFPEAGYSMADVGSAQEESRATGPESTPPAQPGETQDLEKPAEKPLESTGNFALTGPVRPSAPGHLPPPVAQSGTDGKQGINLDAVADASSSADKVAAIQPLPSSIFTKPVEPATAAAQKLPIVPGPQKAGPGGLPEADLLPGLPVEALARPSAELGDTRIMRIRKKPTFVVGMFGSADYNHILVPASSEKRLSESFERAALGYGGGLSLSADFGRLEVETGAIYAARYYPVGIVYVRGSLLSGLRGDELRTTELNMLNIPLHLRYDYVQRNKWRAYILAGGSVQVAFQTNYYTAEAPQFDFMPTVPPPVTDGGGEESEIDRIRRNGKGWLEGGSFEDNAYLTLNLGFGAERYFTERWSLFVQPVYQHSIHYFKNVDGLGPNNDRINSFSVLFGTRVRLK